MKTIRISEEVWASIATHGKFGETEDDVLRRILKISGGDLKANRNSADTKPAKQYGWKERRTTDTMSSRVEANKLILQFGRGARFEKTLPSKDNRIAIRKIRDEAVEFVHSNDGTTGQKHAAIKALTSNGYYVSKVDISEFV